MILNQLKTMDCPLKISQNQLLLTMDNFKVIMGQLKAMDNFNLDMDQLKMALNHFLLVMKNMGNMDNMELTETTIIDLIKLDHCKLLCDSSFRRIW